MCWWGPNHAIYIYVARFGEIVVFGSRVLVGPLIYVLLARFGEEAVHGSRVLVRP